jgi:ribokinase
MLIKNRILVVGSHVPGFLLRVKRPPVPGETVIGWDYEEPVDGGKGSNQAIAAARLGGKVSFVGCVGKDRIGDQAEFWMNAAGVDTTRLRRSPTTASGIGFIMLDESGVPAMVSSLGANAELTDQEVEAAIIGLRDVGVLLTQFEIPIPVAMRAAGFARQQGLLTILNPAPAPETELSGLDCADVLVPNETEARLLLGLAVDQEVDNAWLAQKLREKTGAGAVLITIGERGVVGCDAEGNWAVAPPPVKAVDTSGAGDSFCAALAVALVEGQSVREASAWACRVAALSVTRAGTIPAYPTRAEVDAFER